MAPERPSLRRSGAGRIAALRARIRKLEGIGRGMHVISSGGAGGVVTFGIAEIDDRLPGGGLARGALHEVIAGHAGAATGFCAALLARLAAARAGPGRDDGRVLWCVRPRLLDAGALYGPGLARFGLAPERVVVTECRRDADALWAMEEALRCRRLAAVLGEAGNVTLTASRRLQLAAGAGGVTAILLRPPSRYPRLAHDTPPPSAALTRWRVAAAPGLGGPRRPGGTGDNATQRPDAPCWQAELLRCRGGAPGKWLMEWRNETGDFALAAAVRHRSAVPR